MSSTTPSIPDCTNLSLKERGFVFPPPPRDPNTTVTEDRLVAAWNKFLTQVQTTTGIALRARQKVPWRHLKGVMEQTHADKAAFKVALFGALRSCLTEFCEYWGDPAMIRLKNSKVGFAMNVETTRDLGFSPGYALSNGGSIDHACMVFQDFDEEGNHTGKAGDLTAAVNLKTIYNSCMPYYVQQGLDLENKHISLEQSIRHAMDVHHCLARRDAVTATIPVVELAGRVAPRDQPIGLRCVQGSIHIPEKFGDVFHFVVDRCVPFADETDELAVAIYLETMCSGLINAAYMNRPSAQDAA
jgi:hypothetical protein